MARAATAGVLSGRTICPSTRHRLQPSMRAASSSSTGKSRKNWRIKKTPTKAHRLGTIRPW